MSVDPTPEKKVPMTVEDSVLEKPGVKTNHTASSEDGPVGPGKTVAEPTFKFEDVPEELQ